jgi:crotonyl-CoA carboxylase/reductase
MLVGATAYRMLHGWPPNVVQPGEPVLIWGGAGGLGSMAIQIVKAAGGRAVAVVGDNDKAEYCKKLGAVGTLNRKDFSHWGMLPHWKDEAAYAKWAQGARTFGKAFWEALGEKANPTIVFEHPGEDTVPTSIFMTETGGMVVICAGTTGYNATLDLRYHWMRQKRLQGSHFANDAQAKGANDLVIAREVDPCLSRVFAFADTAACHQLMRDNLHPSGNMAILVNAPRPGLRTLAEVRAEPAR